MRPEGRGCSFSLTTLFLGFGIGFDIPQQARVESHRRQHAEDDYSAKGQDARPRCHGSQGLGLYQGHQDGHDIDIEHRPSSDQFQQAIQAGMLERLTLAAPLYSQQ